MPWLFEFPSRVINCDFLSRDRDNEVGEFVLHSNGDDIA